MALKLTSLLGLIVLLGIAWFLSENRKRIPWKTVFWGLGLQFGFAFLILKTSFGKGIFEVAQRGTDRLLNFAFEGARFVFGPLANQTLLAENWGPQNAFILTITITVIIIFVSALSSLLYHWGVLQRVVQAMAWIMQKTMKTSGSETLAAAANIFMGQTEAPLVIKPYLPRMTQSELLALMVGGMASIAGGVFAVYVSFGASSGHLLTASVMSAPAALLIAKILLPETQPSETASGASDKTPTPAVNSIDAVCRGAADGIFLSLNVIAMLIAFVALVALANYLLGWTLRPFGAQVTFQEIAGWLNAPFAWLMGAPLQDCAVIGRVLGERIVLNEFFGYLSLTQNKEVLTERGFIIATYALCGFANIGSIAVQIGGIGALAPERRDDLARLGVRSMIGGLIACYMTACVVGVLL